MDQDSKTQETCGAHLRNLITPYKNLLALCTMLRCNIIDEIKFRELIDTEFNNDKNSLDNVNELLYFSNYLDNFEWR